LAPLILHIETSSLACSAALSKGPEILAATTLMEKYVHSSALAPLVEGLFHETNQLPTDLEAVAISIGPGSYTGLRVGLSFAKGLCTVLNCPLIPIDTLQSLARSAMESDATSADIYIPALDARRNDAYMAVFGPAGTRLAENSFVTVTPDLLQEWTSERQRVVICGEGLEKWALFGDLPDVEIRNLSCDARNLVSSAVQAFDNQLFGDVSTCVPAYLKAPNITISG
jgi:tRNA threonylcarbamoyladenosine biosynthesis protein TsaB